MERKEQNSDKKLIGRKDIQKKYMKCMKKKKIFGKK